MNTIIFDLSTEGLDPFKHRIIGITTKSKAEERIFTDRDEKKVLEDFWNYIRKNQIEKLIGFNSSNFDIPMLILRSMRHRIKTEKIQHSDLRKIIFKNDYKKGTLKDFQNLLQIEFPNTGFAKMHMSLLWANNRIKDLEDNLLEDVRVTWLLYNNLNEVGII